MLIRSWREQINVSIVAITLSLQQIKVTIVLGALTILDQVVSSDVFHNMANLSTMTEDTRDHRDCSVRLAIESTEQAN